MKESKLKVVSLIIFLISTGAFIANLGHTINSERITTIKEDIYDLEIDHDRMESKASSLRSEDKEEFYTSIDYVDEAKTLDYEFEQLNDTLTNEERRVYVYIIISLIQKSVQYRDRLSIISIYRHFNSSTEDMIITTEEELGYTYVIAWNVWNSFVSTYGERIYEANASEAYGTFFSYDYIQSRPLFERPRDIVTGHEIFLRINQTKLMGFGNITDYFLFSSVISLQSIINQKLVELEVLEADISRFRFGITFTSLAVFIAGLIANRVGDKKLERQIAEIPGARKDILEEKDRLSIALLSISAILFIIGLILPYVLTLYGI